MNYKERYAEAQAIYKSGKEKVATTQKPDGQKYTAGTRVRVSENLGTHMNHFPAGVNATVKYTHAHAYGGSDVKSYCIDIDGIGDVSWYEEHQLKPIYSPANNASTKQFGGASCAGAVAGDVGMGAHNKAAHAEIK